MPGNPRFTRCAQSAPLASHNLLLPQWRKEEEGTRGDEQERQLCPAQSGAPPKQLSEHSKP
jgi:hypothetical protein